MYRFTQPDSLVPNLYAPQSLDRYAYVLNNPVRYNDPTGHMCSDPEDLWSPMCDGSDTRSGDHIIPGNHVGGDIHPNITPDTTSNPGGAAESQVIILDPLLAFGLVPEQRYAPPLNSFQDDLLQEFCSARFGEEFICQLPPMPDCADCIPLPEWLQYIDKKDLFLDSVGLAADIILPGIGGRAANFFEIGGKALDQTDALFGVTQLIKETNSQSTDWYTYGSLATDVGGLFVPIFPDFAGIVINIIHAHEHANRRGH